MDEVVYEAPPREAYTTYEADLNPYGHWVQTRSYGRCWVPNERPRDWRPYTIGHWVNTDDGWAWVAEDREADWGYVTYHYGRWYEDDREGWVWIPGTTWGSAWVAWREGEGVSGWAPLPPQCGLGVDVRLDLVDRYCPPERFVYVDERYLGEPRVYDHFHRRGDVTIINRTTNITNITVVNNRVVNRGVSVEHVERYSGRRVERVQVTEVRTVEEARRAHSSGRPVAYRPESIAKVDTSYRERVDRRVVEARTAEKERVQRRAADATTERKAEVERAQRRAADATAERKAEVDRAQRRATDATVDRKAEVERAQRRATDERAAEVERAQRRAADAAAEKQAEHDRAVRRADDAKKVATPPTVDRSRAARIEQEAAAAKQAENERAARRAEDAKKVATPPTVDRSRAARIEQEAAAAKQAEHDRAVRRAEDAKTVTPPAERSRGARIEQEAQTAKQAEHERAVRRAEDAKTAGKGDSKDDKGR